MKFYGVQHSIAVATDDPEYSGERIAQAQKFSEALYFAAIVSHIRISNA